ncbi:MAG: ArnT family glycosyltransferase [Jatrophihabitans sp.]|uniref:ArnT family glycosyltransferase n=1 Tax=Jatrophihabitans sp. TaxID=1932789 RepID=UPI003F809594
MTTTATPIPGVAAAPPLVAPAERAGATHRRRERGSLLALLVGTAVLYLSGLGASGYANEFYAAAVQAGTQSWKAFFFGSFDSGNAITVDKPPLSLWPMELSGRLFGFNSWSMLVPQALEGVATVALLYATVKRWSGHWAGLVAGAVLALTPVAVLMFRFNNPDAAMTLLIVAAAYCVTRAIEVASLRWLVGAGAVMGLSFLAKGLQPFTVLPALGLAYLVAAPTTLGRRVAHLLAAGVAVVVGAGWWVLAVDLTPASDRPYIGGSGDNTALGLAFGYNGLSRITGGSSGGAGGGPGGSFSGSTGLTRLFDAQMGGQIAWLLPTALVAIAALAYVGRRAPRTDRLRAAVLLWGGWLLVTGAVLSYASGIIHPYYTVELAPAIAALVGIGAVTLWRSRADAVARGGLALGVAAAGITAAVLLHRTPSWHGWLVWLVLVAAAVAVLALLAPAFRRAALVVAIAGTVAVAGGSSAYALNTASTAHTGSTPSAGPTVAGGFGPGGAGGFGPSGSGGARRLGGSGLPTGELPSGGLPDGFPGGMSGSLPTGGLPGSGSRPTGSLPSGAQSARGGGGGTSTSSALVALLKKTTTTWAAAAVGSQSAGALELASGKAVISIGGFNGGDDAPTLAQFEAWVKAGKVAYFIGSGTGGFGGGPGGGSAGSAIATWVASHYKATTVGGQTVYDLSQATS